MNRLLLREKDLTHEKDKLQKLVSQQESSIRELREELAKVNIELTKAKGTMS